MAQGVLEAQATLEEALAALAVLEQAPQQDEQALALALGALAQAQAALEQAQAQAVQAAQDVDYAAHAMVAVVHEVVDAFPQQPAQPGEVHCGICHSPHVPGALVYTTDVQAWCFGCLCYSDYLNTNPTNIRAQGDDGFFHACAGHAGGCRRVPCYC
jgi:hypothetical protein